jgi:perosamine synthetase
MLMTRAPQDMGLLPVEDDNIVLFHPYIPPAAGPAVTKTLGTRWIGQGPGVESFEQRFQQRFAPNRSAVAVGSGTDALHLAYLLAGIGKGDEVITPVFTCTATNIPLLYQGASVRFADIQRDTLNIDPAHVRELVSERTRAIVCVDYGGLPCDMDELRAIAGEYDIPLIEDAAQSIGGTYKGKPVGALCDYTCFSFQAIKHITTGDGGMLMLADTGLTEKARRVRWFGIDRLAKQKGVWENDIYEVGYKYQMTDVAAAMGLAGLDNFDNILDYRQQIFAAYCRKLAPVNGIQVLGADYADREHAAWICTIVAEKRHDLQLKLREHHIESNQVHFRNDRYTVFKNSRGDFPNMDAVENDYLVLPIHMQMTLEDVDRICTVIASGW